MGVRGGGVVIRPPNSDISPPVIAGAKTFTMDGLYKRRFAKEIIEIKVCEMQKGLLTEIC